MSVIDPVLFVVAACLFVIAACLLLIRFCCCCGISCSRVNLGVVVRNHAQELNDMTLF
jgi:hypothetical protein